MHMRKGFSSQLFLFVRRERRKESERASERGERARGRARHSGDLTCGPNPVLHSSHAASISASCSALSCAISMIADHNAACLPARVDRPFVKTFTQDSVVPCIFQSLIFQSAEAACASF